MSNFNGNFENQVLNEKEEINLSGNIIKDVLLNNYMVLSEFSIEQASIIIDAINKGLDIQEYCDSEISSSALKYISHILDIKSKNIVNYDIDYVIGYILDCDEEYENIENNIIEEKIDFIINNYQDKYYPILNIHLDLDLMKNIIIVIDTKYHLIDNDIVNRLKNDQRIFYLLSIYYDIDISNIDLKSLNSEKYSYEYFMNLIDYLRLYQSNNVNNSEETYNNMSIIKRWLDGYEEALRYIENNSSKLSEEERNSWKDGYSKAMSYNN